MLQLQSWQKSPLAKQSQYLRSNDTAAQRPRSPSTAAGTGKGPACCRPHGCRLDASDAFLVRATIRGDALQWPRGQRGTSQSHSLRNVGVCKAKRSPGRRQSLPPPLPGSPPTPPAPRSGPRWRAGDTRMSPPAVTGGRSWIPTLQNSFGGGIPPRPRPLRPGIPGVVKATAGDRWPC